MLKTTMIGHLGKDAELKNINGKSVLNFSIAHSEKYTNNDGVKVENTTWMVCEFWDAEKLTPWLKKGSLVYVEGAPRADAFTNKEGKAVAALRLRVIKLDLLNSTAERSQPQQSGTALSGNFVSNPAPTAEAPDDLPF